MTAKGLDELEETLLGLPGIQSATLSRSKGESSFWF